MHAIKAAKYTLLALNVIVSLSGLVMLITGSVVEGEINAQKMSRTIGGYSTSAGSIICIIFGIAVMLLGAFGFYSTLKDRYAFLYAYSIIMFITFLVQFITGIVALAVKGSSNFDDYVANVLQPELSLNSTSPNEQDFYQSTLKCCGWNGPSDYLTVNNTFEAPESCCKVPVAECDTTNKQDLYESSCNYKLMDIARNIIGAVGGVLLAFGIVNFFSIGLSVFMARQISVGYQYS